MGRPRKKPAEGSLNEFLRGTLDARRAKLEAMLDDVLEPKTVLERVVVECPRCKAAAGGKNMKSIDVEVPITKYQIAEAVKVVKLLAEYGVSRPPEEKRVEVDLNQTIRDVALMSDEELAAWVERG